MRHAPIVTACILSALLGCGHTATGRVGLLSFGDLEGKRIPRQVDGTPVEGRRCGGLGGPYSLAEAAQDALEGTVFDTIVDAQVTNTTGLLGFSHCIEVRGTALRSDALGGRETSQ
ncbi:MAG: hypothetical protein QNK03_09030 [Myxococcota bacterium]|nr:hypothetical protein [Myxococcota bacterium]